jgi:transposase
MPKRGPKCKLGYHQVFNLILWVLYTGMQWKCLSSSSETHIRFACCPKFTLGYWLGKNWRIEFL